MDTPQLNEEFLLKLEKERNNEVFARITLLNINELPIETIEGKITSGSINIDGTSAVRRSCSLSLVAEQVNLSDFYWGIKNKFKLEIGLKNEIDSNYDQIIWFKQGIYVITSFSTALTANNFTINISGKDKMCLLNGDLAGNIMNISEDFGVKWIWQDVAHTQYIAEPILIKDIIYKGVQTYAGELPQNIIINDIAECGFELLEYRSTTPMYMFKNTETQIYENMTLNGNMTCYIDGVATAINSGNIIYDQDLHIGVSSDDGLIDEPTLIKLSNSDDISYTVKRVTAASGAIGYRLTDLVYAGDLIASAGDAFTSILDKIKAMLGNFEYFYDLDGHFVFQKKKNYVQGKWTGLKVSRSENERVTYVENNVSNETFSYIFDGHYFITSLSNNIDVANIKNDFSVWGKRESVNGAEIPIHMRCAIDKKPTYYKAYDGTVYSADIVDWREIIYRMALDYYNNNSNDDFYITIRKNNIIKINGEWVSLYPDGRTGYEKYYTDMEAFWPQLYNNYMTGVLATDLDVIELDKYYIYNGDRTTLPITGEYSPADAIVVVETPKPDVNYRSIDKKTGATIAEYIGYNPNYTYFEPIAKASSAVFDFDIYCLTNSTPFGEYGDSASNNELIPVDSIKYQAGAGPHYFYLSLGTPLSTLNFNFQYLVVSQSGNYRKEIVLEDNSEQYCYVQNNTYIGEVDKSSVNVPSMIAPYDYNYTKFVDNAGVDLYDKDGNLLTVDGIAKVIHYDQSINIGNNKEYYDTYSYTDIKTIFNYNTLFARKINNDKYQALTTLSKIDDLNNIYYISSKIYSTTVDKQNGKTDNTGFILTVGSNGNSYYERANVIMAFPVDFTKEWQEKKNGKWITLSLYDYKYKQDGVYYSNPKKPYNGEENWNPDIQNNPENLNFWFDFLDPEENSLAKYAIPNIGARPKVVNEDSVKAIYYRDIPNVIFQNVEEASTFAPQYGYVYANLNSSQLGLFKMSSQGISAKDKLEELLNQFTYVGENVQIAGVPIYRIDVNTRISIKDKHTLTNGEYIVSRISLPLTYNGTMNITATKAAELVY